MSAEFQLQGLWLLAAFNKNYVSTFYGYYSLCFCELESNFEEHKLLLFNINNKDSNSIFLKYCIY